MTDEQIVKALECHTITMKCGECPYDNAFIGDGDVEINVVVNNNCFKGLGRDAIALIKRQQAEIEYLKNEICDIDTVNRNLIKEKAEAIKGYLNELKCAINPFADYDGETVWKIADEVSKEMVGAE